MQPFSFFFVGYSLGGGGISGRVRALNLTVPLGSGRVGSDNLGYGPGSGFSFEPVQTSSTHYNTLEYTLTHTRVHANTHSSTHYNTLEYTLTHTRVHANTHSSTH